MTEELHNRPCCSLPEGPLETFAASQTLSDSKAIYQLSRQHLGTKLMQVRLIPFFPPKTPDFNDVVLAQHLLTKSHCTLSEAF